MRRREFVAGLAGMSAWSLAAPAQQSSIPGIGLLSSVRFETRRDQVAAFHRALNEMGYVEGQNVRVQYRSAENQVDRLPDLARSLVDAQVSVMVTIGGDITIRAAKDATSTIPIIFVSGGDPIQNGFVSSLSRPDGNLTGISFLVSFPVSKRLELLTNVVPHAAKIGVLVNPNNPNTARITSGAREGAEALARKITIVGASTEQEIEVAFERFSNEKVQAILIEADPFLLARREQLVSLGAAQRLPAIYSFVEFVQAGGLMSYGTSLADAYHEAGTYAARILKGEKPADLPVIQAAKFDLAINLKTAKELDLTIPPSLLARADEVIE